MWQPDYDTDWGHLNKRPAAILQAAGFKTPRQAWRQEDRALLALPGFGRSSLRQLREMEAEQKWHKERRQRKKRKNDRTHVAQKEYRCHLNGLHVILPGESYRRATIQITNARGEEVFRTVRVCAACATSRQMWGWNPEKGNEKARE